MQRGRILATTPLEFSGDTSIYVGTLVVDKVGRAELQILAMQPETANFGMAVKRLRVKR